MAKTTVTSQNDSPTATQVAPEMLPEPQESMPNAPVVTDDDTEPFTSNVTTDMHPQVENTNANATETPEWQRDDYDGPMTIDIATWRSKNLALK